MIVISLKLYIHYHFIYVNYHMYFRCVEFIMVLIRSLQLLFKFYVTAVKSYVQELINMHIMYVVICTQKQKTMFVNLIKLF